jgi:S-formylglutathione hydrolase
MQILEEHVCFGGVLKVVEHKSETLSCMMKFSIFLPVETETQRCPALMFLSGLTCTHDNFTTKAGAYKQAAKCGMIIIAPDTSPRGDDVPDDDAYDFGKGAGFYLDATQEPWAKHYKMESYIAEELPRFLAAEFPVISTMGITGHSMGGHGALTLYMKYPKQFQSVSAFAPIVAPSQVPWGQKALTGYVGSDSPEWLKYDACELVGHTDIDRTKMILIDQGTEDQFVEEQLKPELFKLACDDAGQSVQIRYQDGYDHSYYFIQSFIDDHIDHHAEILFGE